MSDPARHRVRLRARISRRLAAAGTLALGPARHDEGGHEHAGAAGPPRAPAARDAARPGAAATRRPRRARRRRRRPPRESRARRSGRCRPASGGSRNGLTVVLVPDPTATSVSYMTWFRVGSRDENEAAGETGLAHLFEHLMFTQTKNHAVGEFDRAIEAVGGNSNAMTYYDFTAYMNDVPPAELARVACASRPTAWSTSTCASARSTTSATSSSRSGSRRSRTASTACSTSSCTSRPSRRTPTAGRSSGG